MIGSLAKQWLVDGIEGLGQMTLFFFDAAQSLFTRGSAGGM